MPPGRPRNVIISPTEAEALLRAAPPYLYCWISLCADLGLRSGTAARVAPQNYGDGHLRFSTKYGAEQCVGVPSHLRPLLESCKVPNVPFVAQLPRGKARTRAEGQRSITVTGRISANTLAQHWHKLRKQVGIERYIRPHDLRRTVARNVYTATGDLRDVRNVLGHSRLSSTVWYLEAELSAVPASLLELAKLNPITEAKQ